MISMFTVMLQNNLHGIWRYSSWFPSASVFLIGILISSSDAQNQALKKPASQVGIYDKLIADNAVDGNNDTYCLAESGNDNIPAWWSVDLQDDYYVQRILIIGPNVAAQNKYLVNFIVTVKGSDNASQVCFSYKNENDLQNNVSVTIEGQCQQELLGRVINITRNGGYQPRSLGLAEVQVTGALYKGNRAYNKPTKQIGNFSSYISSNAVDNMNDTCALAEANPANQLAWWQVDLGDTYKVLAVWVTVGSAAQMQNYFSDVVITVDSTDTTTSNKICNIYNNGSAVTPGVQLRLDCSTPYSEGRYVTIKRRGGGNQYWSLGMCDVQVIGEYLLGTSSSSITWSTTTTSKSSVSTTSISTTTITTTTSHIAPSSRTSVSSVVSPTSTTFISSSSSPSTSPTITTTTTPPSTTSHNEREKSDRSESGNLGGGPIAGIVIGCIVGAAVLAVLIVLGLWYFRKGRNGSTGSKPGKPMSSLSEIRILDRLCKTKSKEVNGIRPDSVATVRPPIPTKPSLMSKAAQPIPRDELALHIKNLNRDDGYKDEFKRIPDKELEKATIGKLKSNADKNRFANIIPYDKTLVPLVADDKSDAGDTYINASYIKGYPDIERKYIATQGPKEKTLNSFWKMIWQQNVDLIVMITQIHEGGKNKCCQYWPTDVRNKKECGQYKIEMEVEDKFCDYTYREFIVENTGKPYDTTRKIRHMHFQSWNDKSAPDLRFPLLNFQKRVNKLDNGKHPIVVHCSAGVGRTGTYIAIDNLLNQLNNEGKISVFSCVGKLRQQRMNMVQTSDQYKFVYESLVEVVQIGEEGTTIPNDLIKSEYQRLKSLGEIERQLEVLREMKWENTECRRSMGTQRENYHKNRQKDVVAFDDCRPHLNVMYNNAESNYINAVYVNSYRAKDAYTLTQCPLTETVADFWSLVWDQKFRTIILLDEIDGRDKTCPIYWPTCLSSTVSHGIIDISICSTFTEANVIKVYEFSLSSSKDHSGETLKVRMYQLCNAWPSHQAVPSTPAVLLQMMNYMKIWHHQIQSERSNSNGSEGKTIIQCIDGYTKCGLMAAGMCMIERMRMEKEVDVFLSSRYITCNRPQSIDTLEQYNFLFKLAVTSESNFNKNDDYYNGGQPS